MYENKDDNIFKKNILSIIHSKTFSNNIIDISEMRYT